MAQTAVPQPDDRSMRDKNLLQLFLVLNVALGACFVAYLVLSSGNQPQVTATSFTPPVVKTNLLAKSSIELAPTNAVVSTTSRTW